MKPDFATIIKANPLAMRALAISWVTLGHLRVRLALVMATSHNPQIPSYPIILCANAVDYIIRPMNPATIMGGPLVEYHDTHELLNRPLLQYVPGGDGEEFDPPLKLGLLMFDQSYVIAEKFEVEVFDRRVEKPAP